MRTEARIPTWIVSLIAIGVAAAFICLAIREGGFTGLMFLLVAMLATLFRSFREALIPRFSKLIEGWRKKR